MSNNLRKQLEEEYQEDVSFQDENNMMTIKVNHEDTLKVASSLKEWGYNHLSDVTVVDYLEDEEFEIIYHLWDHNNHERLILKTRIPRDNPVINTFTHIWTSAQMHERENHEMFGVTFKGNNNLTPLLLEDWEGVPPLRKDFDSRQYVLDEFYGGERA